MEPMGSSVGLWILVSMSKLGFLACVGKASAPVWGGFAVMRARDSDEMLLINPS
jgi:hypothetical protein